MNIESSIKLSTVKAIASLYQHDIQVSDIVINQTPANFEGHYSIVVFPFVKLAKLKPEEVAEQLGAYLAEHMPEIDSYNVVKGFCNLVVADAYWISFNQFVQNQGASYGQLPAKGKKVVVEYSSPNTNKPLHLGHIRNNLLGWATCQILEKAGYEVIKTQVINDRGIHICKSMLAWQRFGNGETPESSGMKGDHLVGAYYVKFEQAFQAEYAEWQKGSDAQHLLQTWLDSPAKAKAIKEIGSEEADALQKYFFKEVNKNTYFNTQSALGKQASGMLENWEKGEETVIALWKQMNQWVLDGMFQTYAQLGVGFDKNYFESQTYLIGKDIVEQGLAKGAFYRKDDTSVWVDLTEAKLDHKLLLRSNGTSVYITQDIGMAPMRYRDFGGVQKMVYVVGDEQEYHFKVLFEILKRLGEPYANDMFHLSYGMVELPEGKMKSREGTVVDADDLIAEVIEEVKQESMQRETLAELSDEAKQQIWKIVGLGSLKYFILKVDPKKKMIFDPKQSIDLQGHTGPYIQNAYVRTQAVQRKAVDITLGNASHYAALEPAERELIFIMNTLPSTVHHAAEGYNPALIADFAYNLAKAYHRFWNDVSILRAEPDAAAFRIELSKSVAHCLATSMNMLGIQMPDRM